MKHTPKGSMLTEVFLETFKLSGLLITTGDQLVKELNLTSARWKILGALIEGRSSMTVPEIARTMGQSRQAVQRLANEMADDRLIESVENPKHQKAKLICITDRGRNSYNKVMEKQIPWANTIAHEIKEADLESVISTLKFLNSYLGRSS
ncbi:MAG: MarR family winged helix-turn-helix transcriptional regulator [Aliiglaciecola sp.]